MNQLKLFVDLTRLKKPIGFMLLFWPCIWGLTLVYDFSSSLNNYIFYSLLFLAGSILMRSAGCIVNDIIDKNFDKKVERTKNRPIASGKVSVKIAIVYSIILCGLAFLVLINFNKLTIYMALLSMPLAFTYPLMKRITYWPQLFLGITFNYGLLLAWASVSNDISLVSIAFYVGAIFWTLGYDTIYGFQDIKDDEIIGVKSTSIKFKQNPKFFISLCYFVFFICLVITGYNMDFNLVYYIGIAIVFLHLFILQINFLKISSSESCLKIFKSNNFLGMLVFISLLIGKIIT